MIALALLGAEPGVGTRNSPFVKPCCSGTKLTIALQDWPGLSDGPQSVDSSEKSPVVETVPSAVGEEPGLVTVKVCGGLFTPTSTLPKSHGAGEIATVGGTTPSPVSVIVRGLPEALSQM